MPYLNRLFFGAMSISGSATRRQIAASIVHSLLPRTDAMQVPAADMPAVGEAARAVIREAKAAGVDVFGGGIESGFATTMVAADGRCTAETYPQRVEFDGGFCVLELPSRDEAVRWAARLAAACRCAQELRAFYDDPEC